MRVRQLLLTLAIISISCAGSSNWAFDKPPSTFVVTQRAVIDGKKPILLVVHDKDGDWQFLATEFSQIDRVVELPFDEVVALDSTVVQVAKLNRGWKAVRQGRESPWEFSLYK
ncbi:MAG: hypothetical protein WBD36_08205 [Bacteroidota bacterium]